MEEKGGGLKHLNVIVSGCVVWPLVDVVRKQNKRLGEERQERILRRARHRLILPVAAPLGQREEVDRCPGLAGRRYARRGGGERRVGAGAARIAVWSEEALGRLIIVCGLPGSGKTKLARRLESEYGRVRMSADEWMAELDIDLFDSEARGKVEQLQWRAAQRLLQLGGVVVIEWGTWGRKERDCEPQPAPSAQPLNCGFLKRRSTPCGKGCGSEEWSSDLAVGR